MTDVTRLLENAVEATAIVQRFVLLLVKHVLWKKSKKKKEKRRLMQPLYRASHKTGLMQSDLLLGELGDQMYHFIHLTLRLFSRNTTVSKRT